MAEVFHLQADGKHYQVTAESREEAIQKVQAARSGAVPDEAAARREQFFSRIDTSPTQAPEIRSQRATGPLGLTPTDRATLVGRPPTQERPDLQILLENAALTGVDVTTGLRPGIRGITGLLDFNEGVAAATLDNLLRKEYGDTVPEDIPMVWTDAATGLPMYLRQTTDGKLRPTLVNPPGTDSGDFVEFAGEMPTIAFETLGGIGGAVAGSTVSPGAGTVVGGTGGAAIGGALSIPLRVKLAESMGAPKEIIDKIKTGEEAAFQALISGGGELAGFALTGAISGVRNFFGRSLDVDDLPALEAEIQANLKKLRALEQRTGQKIDLTIGELSGDPDLLVAEANLKRSAVGSAAKNLRASEIRSEKAARQALREMATQEVRAPTDGGFRSVESVSDDVRDQIAGRPKAELQGAQAEAVDALTQAEKLANQDRVLDAMTKLRDDVWEKVNQLSALEDLSWDNYRRAAGWDPETRTSRAMIDNRGETPIRAVAQRLEKDGKLALLASLRNPHKATLRNMGFPEEQIDNMLPAEDLSGLAQETLDPFHLHMALSHLKRQLRAVNNGTNPDGWEARDLGELIGAIEDTMLKSGQLISSNTGRPLAQSTADNVRAAWSDANLTTQRLHEITDTNNMRVLLQTKKRVMPDGTLVELPNLPAGLIRRSMLKANDARMMGEAFDAVDHDPTVRVALINELRKLHADTVMPGGRFQQGAHNKFMDEYADHMRLLGVDDSIENVAQFGRAYDNATKELEVLEGRLKEMYGRNVPDPTKPLNISEEILSNRVSPMQARQLMGDLRRMDPELANQVEEKVLENIHLDLTGHRNKVVNSAKLNQMLRKNRETLNAVFGTQYTKDLQTLSDVLELMGEKTFSKSSKQEIQSAFTALTRSVFGPLSRKQRFITAVQRVARNSRAGRVADILENPEALRQFVRLRNLTPRDPRYWTIVQGLNLVEFATETDEAAELYRQFEAGTLAAQQEAMERMRQGGPI